MLGNCKFGIANLKHDFFFAGYRQGHPSAVRELHAAAAKLGDRQRAGGGQRDVQVRGAQHQRHRRLWQAVRRLRGPPLVGGGASYLHVGLARKPGKAPSPKPMLSSDVELKI